MKAGQAGKVEVMKVMKDDVMKEKETEIKIPTVGVMETLVKVWVDPNQKKLQYKYYYCYKK